MVAKTEKGNFEVEESEVSEVKNSDTPDGAGQQTSTNEGKTGDEPGAAEDANYIKKIPRYQQLFKEGKISELFSELKKTTAYPKIGNTKNRNYTFLYNEYKTVNPNFENCPYLKGAIATDFTLDEVAYFVRLYSDDGKVSKWIFRIEDLKKYNNLDELINELAIPFDNGTIFGTKPLKIALIELPKATSLRKSIAGKQVWKRTYDGLNDLIQKGGGIQYEILGIDFKNPLPSVKTWFKEIGDINELFK